MLRFWYTVYKTFSRIQWRYMNSRPKSEDPVDLLADRVGLVCSDGYKWVVGKTPPVGHPQPFLLPKSGSGRGVPVSEEAYLQFATVGPSPDSFLGFANQHGLLGLRVGHFHSDETTAQYGESQYSWALAIDEYQQAFKVWTFIQARDTRGLERFFRSDDAWAIAQGWDCGSTMRYRHATDDLPLKNGASSLLDVALNGLAQQVSGHLGPRGVMYSTFDCFVPGCTINKTRVRVPGTVLYGLTCSFKRGQAPKVEPQIIPANLITAIWLQFSELVSGKRINRSCAVCGKLMDVSETARPGSKRMHDRCSLAQRMRRYRAKISGNNQEVENDGTDKQAKTR